MPRALHIACALAFCAALVLSSACAYTDPGKVTDPAQPGFDVTQFDFDDYRENNPINKDYRGGNLLEDRLLVLFPVGTSREYIEKVLVEYGGASVSVNPEKNQYRHGKKLPEGEYIVHYRKLPKSVAPVWKCKHLVAATYNKEDKLAYEIWANYGCDY
jgi:hypothetical protein